MSDARGRMLKIAQRLFTGGEVTTAWICDTFDVSISTAKRDLVIVEGQLPVKVRIEIPHNTENLPGSRKVLSLKINSCGGRLHGN